MTDFEKGDAWNDTGSNHSSISKTEDESVEGDFCILNEGNESIENLTSKRSDITMGFCIYSTSF